MRTENTLRGGCILECLKKPETPVPLYRGTYQGTTMSCVSNCIDRVTEIIRETLLNGDDLDELNLGSTRRLPNWREKVDNMQRELLTLKRMFNNPTLFWDLLTMVPAIPAFNFQAPFTPQGFQAGPPSNIGKFY
jgi:hypothetical protein